MKKREMRDELKELDGKYNEIGRRIGRLSSVECMLKKTDLPYSKRIMVIPLLPKFKVSSVDMYDGSKNPIDHLENFKAHIMLNSFQGEIAYQWGFPFDLKGNSESVV